MPDRLTLPAPPADPPPMAFPMLAALAPVVGAAALWLVTQTTTMLLFALLGPVIAVASLGDGRLQRRRQLRRERERFARECDALAGRVARAHDDERERRRRAHPDARARAEAPVNDPARWRHEPGEPVPVVVGAGRVASSIVLEPYAQPQVDDVEQRAATLLEAAATLEAPVVVDALLGIGVTGEGGVAEALARSLVLQVLDRIPPASSSVVVEAGDAWSWLDAAPHRVERTAASGRALVRILADEADVTIAVASTSEGLPRDCRVVIRAGLASAAVDSVPCRPVVLSERETRRAAERLCDAAVDAGLGGHAALPTVVPLDDLAQRADGVLAATFLVGASPIAIDLALDGPHAVVGGTTGSGKSELLIAWVAALAQTHDPTRLAILLVDFKGGASFEPLRALRHCVGVITDLDERGAVRAIESLRAEIRHRERMLQGQGARSIEEASGLERLVIVVDEFAAMLHDLPDLHRLFADVAARGRSLGMHLVLCTQRPAEAVRDAVLANCGVRISLRVPDDADAVAVTGVVDAARIRLEERGRCVVRIAGRATVHAQSAIAAPATLARTVAESQRHRAPRRPWCEPLADRIPAATLPVVAETGGIVLGLVDRPAEQRVDPAVWRPAVDGPLLVLGAAATGRSTLLGMLARAGAQVVVDEEALWDAVHAPMRAGVLAVDDVDALLARLGDEHAHETASLLARRMREGAGIGHFVALTARRSTAAMSQLAPLADCRILLRLASRQEHVLAGGATDRYDAALPPGGGWLGGDRVQIAVADEAPSIRAAERVAMPAVPCAFVLGSRDDLPSGVGAVLVPAEVASGASVQGAAIAGTVGEWEAAWGVLERLRHERPVVVLGVEDRALRQVLRGAPLSPATRGERRWVLDRGVTRRLEPR